MEQVMREWRDADIEALGYVAGTRLALEGTAWLGLAWTGWQCDRTAGQAASSYIAEPRIYTPAARGAGATL